MVELFQVDLVNEEEVEVFVVNVYEIFGCVDIFYNNVVFNDFEIYSVDCMLLDVNFQYWDKIFVVNVKVLMFLVKVLILYMIVQGGGVIVNMLLGVGMIGLLDMFIVYGISKGVFNMFMFYIVVQYGVQNICCNVLVCGVVLIKGFQVFFIKE